MKKILAILLSISLLLALSACGKSETPAADENASPAQKLFAAFQANVKANPDSSAEALAAALSEHEVLPFAPVTMPVAPGYLSGFTAEITGFSEGAIFAPMIGAIPFVGYVFKLDESADVNAFVQNLKDLSDLRWNICVEADEMLCDAVDHTVFFVMSPTSFDEAEPE